MDSVQIVCNRCGKAFPVEGVPLINTDGSPELKEKLLSGELFLRECPHCGARNLARYSSAFCRYLRAFVVFPW